MWKRGQHRPATLPSPAAELGGSLHLRRDGAEERLWDAYFLLSLERHSK